ncbi:MAG: hypothetical protein DRQ51_07745 [Gammaproteobacteria bacterium]|nr:MAG: hypothetical protein DRQ51_07745 [Gammaproteobacteria bacterium]
MRNGNKQEHHDALNRGTTIIEHEELLYKYVVDYSNKHKQKLYSAYDTIAEELNNKTINIVDWGCGQALATVLFCDYIKEKNLNIAIDSIVLIEPSALSINRGLLYLDVLDKKANITTINKSFDLLSKNEFKVNNTHNVLNLFSSVLDVEKFKLNQDFLEKVSNLQHGTNYYVCVSPNIDDKRNARLDTFCNYFKDNFNADVLSQRDGYVGGAARYEKIFRARFIG